jgi:DNA-nicking Smr family endonuclease
MNNAKPVAKLTARPGLRLLTPDEEDLWSVVARTVRPLRPVAPVSKRATAVGEPKRAMIGRPSRPTKAAGTAEPGGTAADQQPAAGVPALNPIMRKEKQKLVRGRAAIDARIDLHGMTQTEAHAALRRLLQRSQASGAKFVLVITGKGEPNAPLNGRGVLRRQVPQWLALPEFRRYVAGFDVAHAGHGGEGALYVRLRKAALLR